ncbi:hypothetical protein H0H92_004675 [Tricholoma furcatifolium]|nr:hypothetical protein H0H92_004675 [Tricholoma furcatifolium]
MNNKDVTVMVKGRFVYQQIGSFDNRKNTDRTSLELTHTKYREFKTTIFNESVSSQIKKRSQSAGASMQTSVSYGIASVSISGQYSITDELEEMLQVTQRSEDTITGSDTQVVTQKYYVGPESELYVYYKHLEGPGLKSTSPVPVTRSVKIPDDELTEEVDLKVTLVPIRLIKGFKLTAPFLQIVRTAHGADAPADRVRERDGNSDNINHGQGGYYVWLVPETTTDVAEALTHIDFFVTAMRDRRNIDLATGSDGKWNEVDISGLQPSAMEHRTAEQVYADLTKVLAELVNISSHGKDYRYLIPKRNPGSKQFISHLELRRSSTEITGKEQGYGRTGNINEKREGDWLYLTWKLEEPISM